MGSKLKLGIIGLGTMGRCVVSGILESKKFTPPSIGFTTRQGASPNKAAADWGIVAHPTNADLVAQCETVVLAVKPQSLLEVLKEIAPAVRSGQTFISIVAGVPTASIEKHLGAHSVVLRAMPNTPAQVRAAITAVCCGKPCDRQRLGPGPFYFR